MDKGRLEAFSDGVIAIVITIMVFELKAPANAEFEALWPRLPVFLCYLLSFLYIGVYWNNHHHLLKVCRRVTGGVMWANLNFLFWLSLFPFVTGWMGGNHLMPAPTMLYGVVLLVAAIAYYILQSLILKDHGKDSKLSAAIGGDFKGKISPLLYAIGIGASFYVPILGAFIYVAVALMWLVPDKRIEKALEQSDDGEE